MRRFGSVLLCGLDIGSLSGYIAGLRTYGLDGAEEGWLGRYARYIVRSRCCGGSLRRCYSCEIYSSI